MNLIKIFMCFVLVLICEKAMAVEPEVCFKERCVKVELAITEMERAKGLQGREELAEDRGMFFEFEQSGVYRFWMSKTLIPLDIIWLDENLKVVYFQENVLPCQKDPCPTYGSDDESLYVLEVQSGFVNKNKIVRGERFEFKSVEEALN